MGTMRVMETAWSARVRLWAVVVVTVLVGCAPANRVRVGERLYEDNPMDKVAVFGAGKVIYPRLGRDGKVVVDLAKSQRCIAALLEQTRAALEDRGYQVVHASPVLVGCNCAGDLLVEDMDGEEGASEPQPIAGAAPVYRYPPGDSGEGVHDAAEALITEVEVTLRAGQLDHFVPSKSHLDTIRDATGADTVCIQRAFGRKYTSARKFGDAALGVLAAMLGAYRQGKAVDAVESYLIFMNTATGAVLWQYGVFSPGDPVAPNEDFTDARVLAYLPPRGSPLDPERCEAGDDGLAHCR